MIWDDPTLRLPAYGSPHPNTYRARHLRSRVDTERRLVPIETERHELRSAALTDQRSCRATGAVVRSCAVHASHPPRYQ
jgi:hypothetical protein